MKCDHGRFNHKTVRGHQLTHFMDTFIETLNPDNSNVDVQQCMKMTFEKNQEVWKDDAMREMAIDAIVSIGANLIIDRNECARHLCIAIILLENYDGEVIFHSVLSEGTEEIGYILNAEERDEIHFYKKRIPCSCLDKMYSKIKKSQVRCSECFHCKQTIKRKYVKTCSRCKLAQYCSKECQTLDWPSHKEGCMELAGLHKVAKKAETARSKKE